MMSVGMDAATARAVERLSSSLIRQATAAERLAAAIEAHTALLSTPPPVPETVRSVDMSRGTR